MESAAVHSSPPPDNVRTRWVLAVERGLRVFSDVRPGEGTTALLLLMNVFLLLAAYYFLKPLRDGWLAVTDVHGLSKIEIKAYSSFGQSIVLLAIVPFLGFLASRVSRRALITGSILLFVSHLGIFWVLHPDTFAWSPPYSGIAFYLWVGIFSVTVVAQFWAFATDVYEADRGERLFPLIAIGATAGAIVGSWVAEKLVTNARLEPYDLLLAAMVPLLGALVLTWVVDARGQTGRRRFAFRSREPAAPGKGGPYSLIFGNKYLFAAAMLALFISWVNTNGENILFAAVQQALAEQAARIDIGGGAELAAYLKRETTAFYSSLYFWVNTFALVIQAFLASRILKYGGFAAILFFTPLISFLSYGLMAIFPALAVIRVMKIAENSSNYSANNTARHLLWLPASPTMIYKAKAAIDTTFVRGGDGLAAITVLLAMQVWVVSLKTLLVFNILLVLAWGVAAYVLARENRRLTAEAALRDATRPEGTHA
jgi:ATP:ADP antiporter, AAA family